MASSAMTEVDLRVVPENERPDLLLRSFDELSPGERIELVLPGSGRKILERLQRDRPWQYDWNVIGLRPSDVRVEVSRRANGLPPKVHEFLGADVQRLLRLHDDSERGLAHRLGHPVERFHAFSDGLRRHLAVEEELVLPRLEADGTLSGEALLMILLEHQALEHLLFETEAKLDAEDEGFAPTAHRLAALLGSHNLYESRELHAAADRLRPGSRERLLRHMQTIVGSPGDAAP